MEEDSRFDELCDRFEASWKGAQPLAIEELLRELPEHQDKLLLALLEIELEYRIRSEQPPEQDEYQARFAAHRELVGRAFATTLKRLRGAGDGFDETQVESSGGATSEDGKAPRRVGAYQVLKSIGRGSLGHVFLAEHVEKRRRRVAIKILEIDTPTKEILSRFENERQLFAEMNHPHLAKVLGAGRTDSGNAYFVMEHVKGMPMTRVCDKFTLSVKQRLQLFVQCCDAIAYAHRKGATHGDIRPSNVLVTQRDGAPMVKVTDLGLASVLQTTPLWGGNTKSFSIAQVVSIICYTSPEQATGSPVDLHAASDIYSLGVLLYELLTGTTPIEKRTLRKMSLERQLAAVRGQDAPPPSTRVTRLGDNASTVATQRKTEPGKLARLLRSGLDEIVMRALQKEVGDRFTTARELADEILSLLKRGTAEQASLAISGELDADQSFEAITKVGDPLESVEEFSFDGESFDAVLAPPKKPNEIGSLGEFNIRKLLGAGGMGFVFLANTGACSKPVALKVMKPAIVLDPNAKQRFLREARAAKDLKHPNIVSTHDVGDINGNPYITMEYLEGRSLQSVIEEKKPLEESKILRFAKDITAGLAFAHSRELVHRDIKPSNLWVCEPSEKIKILDFGLVRDVSHGHVSLTETGVLLGSPKYMSPEQTRGEKVGFASDLFSLGSILYRLATGQDAFQGRNVTTTLLAIAKNEPKAISSIRPGLGAGLSQLIQQLLRKAPQDRPASAAMVHARLSQLGG